MRRRRRIIANIEVKYAAKSFPRRGLLKKSFESAGRNPFLPDYQASQGRQERIPDDAIRILASSTLPQAGIQYSRAREPRPYAMESHFAALPLTIKTTNEVVLSPSVGLDHAR